MIKNISQTRQRYEKAYRRLRLYSGMLHNLPSFPLYDEYYDCAILSYDYHDSDFSGWINRQRFDRFRKAMLLNKNSYWGIPF